MELRSFDNPALYPFLMGLKGIFLVLQKKNYRDKTLKNPEHRVGSGGGGEKLLYYLPTMNTF